MQYLLNNEFGMQSHMQTQMQLHSSFPMYCCPAGSLRFAPATPFEEAWQQSLLQQPLVTCQLMEAVIRTCSSIAVQPTAKARQAVLIAHQMLKSINSILKQRGEADAIGEQLRAALACSQGLAEQLFMVVVSQLKLLRGFYRLHAGSSSAGLMMQGWHALGMVHTALDCALAAASPPSTSSSGSSMGSSSNVDSSKGPAAGTWPLAEALALRDAAEILQHLLQGHGLPPMYNANLLSDMLKNCAAAVLILFPQMQCIRMRIRREMPTLVQMQSMLELVQQLQAAAVAAAAAVAQAADRTPANQAPTTAAAAAARGPLKGFSSEELRRFLTLEVTEKLMDFSTAAVATLPARAPEPSDSADGTDLLATAVGSSVNQLCSLLCNSPSCTNSKGLSEQQLVAGGKKRCSACHCAVYCCKECQVEHWKMGHRKACKQLAAASATRGS
jgi:hypothetical protein